LERHAAAPALGAAAAPIAGDVCERFGEPEVIGTVEDPGLVEASGLAASHAWPGVLWSHNDSGGDSELFALSSTGAALGTYSVQGADAVDWEDMAVGPGPEDGSYLYVADIGDNRLQRDDLTVYRMPEPDQEPDGSAGQLDGVERFHLEYPFDPIDAESLFVDPVDGSLYVITKNYFGTRNSVLSAPASALQDGADVEMSEVATFDVEDAPVLGDGLPGYMVTAADISPSGDLILVRTYQAIMAFDRPPDASVAEAFDSPSCPAPHAEEEMGEAIAVSGDGTAYLTVSEGERRPLHRVSISAGKEPDTDAPASSGTNSSPSSSATTSDGQPADTDIGWATLAIAGMAGLALVAGIVTLVVRRRQPPPLR